jgi:hypothetical protein
VALAPNPNGAVRPFLLTSRNAHRYRCTRLEFPRLLPPAVKYVTFAEPIDAPRASG